MLLKQISDLAKTALSQVVAKLVEIELLEVKQHNLPTKVRDLGEHCQKIRTDASLGTADLFRQGTTFLCELFDDCKKYSSVTG